MLIKEQEIKKGRPSPLQLTISVLGMEPAPKGSLKGFVVPGKFGKKSRAVLVEDNKKTKPFRTAVTSEAILEMGYSEWVTDDSAISVSVVFNMLRPKSAKKRRHMKTKPDIDKLLRTVFDALQDAQVFPDDSRVCSLNSTKVYVNTPEESGALIYVNKLSDDEPIGI